jgi:hypothetical protein
VTYLTLFDARRETWRLERQVLVEALDRDWSERLLDTGTSPGATDVRDVYWTYSCDDGELELFTNTGATCLYLDGDVRCSAAFAVWYRGLVPTEIEVIFCDEAYTFQALVRVSTTAQELIDAAS